MNNGPCMCGGIDCSRCYSQPHNEDEEEQEDRRDHEREQMTEQEEYEAELAYEQQLWKDTGC